MGKHTRIAHFDSGGNILKLEVDSNGDEIFIANLAPNFVSDLPKMTPFP